MEQLFIDREWFDFCQNCGAVNAEFIECTLCEACWQKSERDRAARLGIPFDTSASYDTISDLLDRHVRVCQYLSLVWNDCLARDKSQAIFSKQPWFPFQIKGIPIEEVESLAVEILADDATAGAIGDAMFSLLLERTYNLQWESNPDNSRRLVGDYWPPVPHDELYQSISILLWDRWHHHLPLRLWVPDCE